MDTLEQLINEIYEDKEFWQMCGSEEIVDQAVEALKNYEEASK